MTEYNDRHVYLTEKQREAWRYCTSLEDAVVMYGGAKGGGKSYFGCIWVAYWMDFLIEYFGITKQTHPHAPVLGFIGRKNAVDLTNTTLETWKKVIPAEHYEIKNHTKEIVWKGLAKISFGGLDKSENVNKFNSAELCFFFIDQAEETKIEDIGVLRGSLRAKYNGKTPPYKQLFTANPAECWLKQEFGTVSNSKLKTEKHVFIPALPTDNPHLPDSYIQTLKDSFSYDENLLRAYLYGDWNVLSGFRNMFPYALIEQNFDTIEHSRVDGDLKIITADIARFGNDKTSIRCWRNNVCIQHVRYGKQGLEHTYGVIRELYDQMNTGLGRAPIITLDTTDPMGGGGLFDRLSTNLDPNLIIGVDNSANSVDKEKYANDRAAYYHRYRLSLEKNIAKVPKEEVSMLLAMQSVTYEYTNKGKLILTPKDKLKETCKDGDFDGLDSCILWQAGYDYLISDMGLQNVPGKWIESKPEWVQARDDRFEQRQLQEEIGDDFEMGLYA